MTGVMGEASQCIDFLADAMLSIVFEVLSITHSLYFSQELHNLSFSWFKQANLC